MAQEERTVPRVPSGPRPSARRPAVRPKAHDVPQAQRSTSSSRARPEADVPVQLHPVAWVRALRAQASQSAIQSQEVTEANSAKAQAVAALQRLFFEALRSGQDANGAAAQALRRLLEPAQATEGPKACHDQVYAIEGSRARRGRAGARTVAVET
ncbi:Uncharacterized protein SCF082_LOCUS11486 [Durusdinium trenchii]|uniref:Uncharacterized protein n=1 Tax=Durusdinium trenchii TaxID=1381693 RepID=A0ABP0JD61_9DINO